ncbi:GxxExxY protein [Roseibacillus persicicus]|uniref:GxxExxY protein n=1 Tax=Roseibacillus persicicus TaxID=454148 RepID=UPI00280CC676|nr:GxxExxY protein [Roseibacillus persicicus]MDQ8189780.1 GxxExxY protein [Roseibacillus persicicus]
MELNEISERVIGAAIEVHRLLGPGLLEQSYEKALGHELSLRKLSYSSQISLPISYKELQIPDAYRIDRLVENLLIIEIKAVENVLPVHKAQLLTYLRHTEKPLGLLINFNSSLLKNGLTRIINTPN